MAGIDKAADAALLGTTSRRQYGAVLRMRAHMLANSLRTVNGKFELGARIVGGGFLAVIWLGVGAACGAIAHEIASDKALNFLPILLWPLFIMWQSLPLLLASAQENVDFSLLLRFPVSFNAYTILYLSFGIFDPSSLMGGIALLGIWVGLLVAEPRLALPAAVVLSLFGLFNFLLTRMIFAWIERWLSKRRSREILGMVALSLFVGLQLLNPLLHRVGQHSSDATRAELIKAAGVADNMQKIFPPGLAGNAISQAEKNRFVPAALLAGGVAAYALAAGFLLIFRLRAEYRGENLGEAPVVANVKSPSRVEARSYMPAGSTAKWRDGPVPAILGKELRYLSRSGVMLFSLFVPVMVLFAASGSVPRDKELPTHFIFPIAVAYAFLPLTRLVCNTLGGEGAGIQIYFLAPVHFRTVMLAKNILHVGLFGFELALVAMIAALRFGFPDWPLLSATICWLVFALPANLAAGNLLSILMAYRMTLTRMSREQGSVGNGLMSLLVQAVVFGVGVAVYLPLAVFGHPGWAAPVLLLFGAMAFFLWRSVVTRIDGLAAGRREILMAALVRPA